MAVWLSLRRGEQRHPPEGGTWGLCLRSHPSRKHPEDASALIASPSPLQVLPLDPWQVAGQDVDVVFGVDLHQLQPKHLQEAKI